MKKLIPILLVFGLLLIQINVPSIAQDMKSISQEKDLGWVTAAESAGNVELTIETSDTLGTYNGYIYVYNDWNFSAICGASLPINLTVIHPTEFTPGENLTVNVSVESLPGYIFFNTSGDHKLNVTIDSDVNTGYEGQQLDLSIEMSLLLANSYDTSFRADIDTPIGNVTRSIGAQMAHSNSMSLNMKINVDMRQPALTQIDQELTVDSSITMHISFDIIIVAKTKILGHITATGSALSQTIDTTIEWTEEGIKGISLPIKPNASSTDTVDLSVELEYIVNEFYIEFDNITLITDIDEEKISQRTGEIFNSTASWVATMMGQIIQSILSKYNGTLLMNISSIGESKPIEQLELSMKATDGNTIRSDSPYGEETLLSESISIEAAIKAWYMCAETYVAVAAIVGCVAVIYVVIRKNKKK